MLVPIGYLFDAGRCAGDIAVCIYGACKAAIFADYPVVAADEGVLRAACRAEPKDSVQTLGGVLDLEFYIGERVPCVVADGVADLFIDRVKRHVFQFGTVEKLVGLNIYSADTRLFRPFREGLARALGCEGVNGNAEIAYQLCRSGRDAERGAVAGQPAFGEEQEGVALADGADHIEYAACVGAEHLFGDGVHQPQKGAQELVGIEMLAHDICHAARIERHGGKNMVVIRGVGRKNNGTLRHALERAAVGMYAVTDAVPKRNEKIRGMIDPAYRLADALRLFLFVLFLLFFHGILHSAAKAAAQMVLKFDCASFGSKTGSGPGFKDD